jgi:hypothetical protein
MIDYINNLIVFLPLLPREKGQGMRFFTWEKGLGMRL